MWVCIGLYERVHMCVCVLDGDRDRNRVFASRALVVV